MTKVWKLAEPITAKHKLKFPEIDPVILQLLANRGLKTQEQIDEFLMPDYSQDLHDPFLFTKMNQVLERIWLALEKKQKIVIYSDYDADGVTSGTIIYTILHEIGNKLGFPQENLDIYIPHRDKEGYGMNQPAVEKLAEQGLELLISTDCGISNFDEIEWLKNKGIDTIVIDHHQVPDQLPNALIIHTFIPGEIYPFKPLAAVGVAFKVAAALLTYTQEKDLDFQEGYEKWFLDLVAIATVADLMPLLGENRSLLKYGLIVLNKTRRPGLRALIQTTGTPLGKISSQVIGFQIGPRINAASRMDHANMAFRLLSTEDENEAQELANKLNQLNQERQSVTQQIYEQALAQIGEVGKRKILFAQDASWSPSIVGLVAGKISEEYYRPCILIGQEAGQWVGSGRSIPEFDITLALHSAEEHLKRFGGHAGACGFDLKSPNDLQPFIEKISQKTDSDLAQEKLQPRINIECELPLEEATFDLADELNRFSPFGMDNPKPIFLARDLIITSFEALGLEQSHLKVMVKTPREQIKKLIGFNISERIRELKIGAKIDLIYELGVNEWNGNQELQFKIIDFKIEA